MKDRTCSIDGCSNPKLARRMCSGHYQSWRKHGGVTQNRRKWTTDQRFDSHTIRTTNGCLIWTGARNTMGYSIFQLSVKRTVYAHIHAWERVHGPVPDGLTVDHHCHTIDPTCMGGATCPHRACVEPTHLRVISRGANTLAGNTITGNNARKTHCLRGHSFDPSNTYWSKGHRSCRACHLNRAKKR
jgi:hypothetical protein